MSPLLRQFEKCLLQCLYTVTNRHFEDCLYAYVSTAKTFSRVSLLVPLQQFGLEFKRHSGQYLYKNVSIACFCCSESSSIDAHIHIVVVDAPQFNEGTLGS
jgi:hypothetical protein